MSEHASESTLSPRSFPRSTEWVTPSPPDTQDVTVPMQQQKIPADIVGPGNIGTDPLAKLAGELMAHAKLEASA